MSIDRAQLGDNIRRLRRAIGMTQQDVADKVSCSLQAISQIERGASMPSVESLAKIADTLGVSYGVLLGEPLATAEHAVAQVRAEVRALGFDLALIPRELP